MIWVMGKQNIIIICMKIWIENKLEIFVYSPQPSVDLKQALLSGASSYTLTTLQTVISTLEAAERRVEGLVNDCHIKCQVCLLKVLVFIWLSNSDMMACGGVWVGGHVHNNLMYVCIHSGCI